MKFFVEEEEMYPVSFLYRAREQWHHSYIELTEEEFLDFEEVKRKFLEWNKRISTQKINILDKE